ncbi:hypothetical protein [Vibrio sagamiensis]|uniref:Uncharacterized protein n=1 Tax=Vibrio sagamiensis NBRC 104589 TaxID=1219064 RepID=A0A511QJH6_9VIBR|nr:hypothetical protein [Vibrio sagamiensis]PNQ69303.1 hypothetical protein C1141_06230 [Vibrio agarivorans]GEM77347.1 hypothetical protein VSA01S_34590 [Vibrio sagamiensis NBRC 104589]
MSWQSGQWRLPPCTQAINDAVQSVTQQIPAEQNQALARLSALGSKVTFTPPKLSAQAQQHEGLRAELDRVMAKGQALCVHPYQQDVGSKHGREHHLTARTAIHVLAKKLRDTHDGHHPKGTLYGLAWMLSEANLAAFASATRRAYAQTGLPELGMVSRRASWEQTQQADNLTQPPTIIQPRLLPRADLNVTPWRVTRRQVSGQLAQLESLSQGQATPVDKLAALAQKREQHLQQLQAMPTFAGGSLHRLFYQGEAGVLATVLEQSTLPSITGPYTFAVLFLSVHPLNYLMEVLA